MNAIEYIKKSSVFDAYEWVKPLVTQLLYDKFTDESLESTLMSISSSEVSATIEDLIETESEETESEIAIRRVVSIDKIENIGLLNLEQKLPLNEGLNIFYGRNGAGKSSIYSALCKVLGKTNKQVYSNLYSDTDTSSVQITLEDNLAVEKILSWKTGMDNSESNVMIFDSQISNYLVEQDQINHFNLAHLKAEYFSHIRTMLDKLETRLRAHLDHHSVLLAEYRSKIEAKVPFVLTRTDLTKEKLAVHQLSEVEDRQLKSLEIQITLLQKEPSQEVLKNLGHATTAVKTILGLLGTTSTDGQWELKFNPEYFERINSLIRNYVNAKSAFENGNEDINLIPQGWVSNSTWNAFISSSIKFIDSLDSSSQSIYTDKTCVYCLQPLQTQKAHQLMVKYRELQQEHSSKVKSVEETLNGYIHVVEDVIKAFVRLDQNTTVIESEFVHLGKQGQKCIDCANILSFFHSVKTGLQERIPIELEEGPKYINEFWGFYVGLDANFNSVMASVKVSNEKRRTELAELSQTLQPLKESSDLFKFKQEVIQYLETVDLTTRIRTKINDLSNMKRSLSQLESRFTNEEVLKTFEELLKEEYANLGFTPPEVWRLRSTTRGDTNKRVYSLNDKKLSQIFSEGERKIHALADFFAQCELNNFKGVYIFDDPVNSLDEEKMEYVTRRILRLVDDGNQVFIFTHNLVFLNWLIDPTKERVNKITRLAKQVHVEVNTHLNETSSMKARLREITQRMDGFSRRNPLNISEYEIRNVYDLISGYLEDYVEVTLLKGLISRYRPNIRMNSIVSLKTINIGLIDDLRQLYEQTSRKGSRHSHPLGSLSPTYSELVGHVEILKEKFTFRACSKSACFR